MLRPRRIIRETMAADDTHRHDRASVSHQEKEREKGRREREGGRERPASAGAKPQFCVTWAPRIYRCVARREIRACDPEVARENVSVDSSVVRGISQRQIRFITRLIATRSINPAIIARAASRLSPTREGNVNARGNITSLFRKTNS